VRNGIFLIGNLNYSVSDPDSFFTDPDPGFFPQSRSGSRQKAKTKFWEKFLLSTQKVGILFLFSTNQEGILLNRELLFGIILKNEIFMEKVDFYSSISLSGSGFRIRIRIQTGNLNPDPPGSGSETLLN